MSQPAADTTGRFLVLLDQDRTVAGAAAVGEAAGVVLASSGDWPAGAVDADHLERGGGVVFEELGIAVVAAPAERAGVLGATADEHEAVLAIEPERRVHVFAKPAPPEPPRAKPGRSRATWGLEATRVTASSLSGNGVRVAVLDTGFDVSHPDFAGRSVRRRSFIRGERADDGHGHGTHCIGTACGPREPQRPPRYGIAYAAEIWAGKVLGNDGSGVDGGILAGMNWAVAGGCRVISMSLGAPVEPGQPFSRVFEAAAKRATAKGTLVVAAAGNDSDRRARIFRPVGHPANCPSILAVGALRRDLGIAPFSNRGVEPNGGQVDIAAPGVDVRSSWPMPDAYRTLAGTSMATPHVAGVVALLAEADPGASAREVQDRLTGSARRLRGLAEDVGAGLVQAP